MPAAGLRRAGAHGGAVRAHLHHARPDRPDHRYRGGGRAPYRRLRARPRPRCAGWWTAADPVLTFLCSPNNPTGRADPPGRGRARCWPGPRPGGGGRGLRAVRPLRRPSTCSPGASRGADRVVVVRTFSKTWSMAGARLGYLVGRPTWCGPASWWPCRTTWTRSSSWPAAWPWGSATRWRPGWPCSARSGGASPPPSPTSR